MKRGRRLRILAVTLLLGIAGFIGLGIVWPQFALDAEYARLRYLADASTETTVVDDHTIVSLRAGDGPPVVLLHGFTGMKENWLQLMPHLSARQDQVHSARWLGRQGAGSWRSAARHGR